MWKEELAILPASQQLVAKKMSKNPYCLTEIDVIARGYMATWKLLTWMAKKKNKIKRNYRATVLFVWLENCWTWFASTWYSHIFVVCCKRKHYFDVACCCCCCLVFMLVVHIHNCYIFPYAHAGGGHINIILKHLHIFIRHIHIAIIPSGFDYVWNKLYHNIKFWCIIWFIYVWFHPWN